MPSRRNTVHQAPWALLCALLLGLTSASAQAQARGDGVYGRFDTDLSVQVDVGAGLIQSSGAQMSFVAELRARVIDAAGLVVAVDAAPSGPDHVFVGLELRPLWPALFLMDASTGHERWDLLLQSLGIELGAGLTPLGDGLGVGLSWGVGVEVPLWLPDVIARGIWLRLGARRQAAHASAAGAPNTAESAWLAYAALAIRGGLDLGFAAWEPPRYRMPAQR